MSLSGRPISDSINLISLVDSFVKLRIFKSLSTNIMAISELLKRFDHIVVYP